MKKGLLTTLLAATASVSGIQSVHASAPTIQPLPDVTIGDAANNGATDNNYFVFTNAFSLDAKAYDRDGTPPAQLLWSFIEGTSTPGGQWYQINGKNPLAVGTPTAGDLAKAQRPDLVPNSEAPSANNVVGGSKNLREQTATQTALGYNSSYATFRDIVFSPGWGPLTPGAGFTGGNSHANGKPVTFFVSDQTNVSQRDIMVRTVDNAANALSQGVSYTKKRDDDFTTSSIWWGKMQPNNPNLTYDGNTGSLRAFVPTGATGRIFGWAESEYWKTQIEPAVHPIANELKYAEVGASNWIRAKFHIFAQALDGSSNVTNLNQIPALRVRISAPLFSFGSFIDILPHNSADAISNKYALDMSPTTSSVNARVYRVDMDPPEYNWGAPGYIFNSYVQNPNQLGFTRMFEAFSRPSEPQEQGYLCLAESSIGTYGAIADNQFTTVHEYGLAAADWTTPATSIVTPGGSYAEAFIFKQDSGGVITTQLASRTPNGSTGDGAPQVVTAGTANGFDMNTIAVDNRTDGGTAGHYAVASVNWYYGNAASNDTTRARAMPDTLYRTRFTAGATVASSNNAMIRFRTAVVNNHFNARLEVGGAIGGTEFAWGYLPGTGSTWANQTINGQANSGIYDVIFVTPFEINEADMTKTTPDNANRSHLGALPAQGQPGIPSLEHFWRELTPGADIIDEYIADPTKSSSADGHVKITNIKIQSTSLPTE